MRITGPGRAAVKWPGMTTIACSAAALATMLLAVAPAHAHQAVTRHHKPFAPVAVDTEHDGDIDLAAACAPAAHPGQTSCLAIRRTHIEGSMPHSAGARVAGPNSPYGYGPVDLQRAYRLPASRGSGRTVAIVDAYNDPNAESDLATYRRTFGLPACTTANGCFTKINQNGGGNPPSSDAGWAAEISLDLDMVSATCPNCHILLVEATSSYLNDLGTAVNMAVRRGARFVSNSYGAPEDSADPSYDSQYFNHAGVAITASAGDGGYGTAYPAASKYVISVGGTTLRSSSGSRGWYETVWGGTGSGCSSYDPKQSWQTDSGCRRRTATDVAAVADPDTGVAIYDTYQAGGWQVYGGTSASSPIIAAMYALAGAPASGSYPAAYLYAHPAAFYDVTSGSNGSCGGSYLCVARRGYDGPTGLGTPAGITAFSP